MPTRSILRNLLWVDCTAAALVGVTVVALSDWLSRLEGLPREVLLFTGVVNLLYASYSFSLAARPERAMWQIKLLVFANLGWVPVCLALALAFRDQATWLGLLHLTGEALFVGGLAMMEWSRREQLLTAA